MLEPKKRYPCETTTIYQPPGRDQTYWFRLRGRHDVSFFFEVNFRWIKYSFFVASRKTNAPFVFLGKQSASQKKPAFFWCLDFDVYIFLIQLSLESTSKLIFRNGRNSNFLQSCVDMHSSVLIFGCTSWFYWVVSGLHIHDDSSAFWLEFSHCFFLHMETRASSPLDKVS